MSNGFFGPWKEGDLGLVFDSRGQIAMIVGVELSCLSSADPKKNTRLAVSAPELLEALEGMLENEHQRKFESWYSSNSPSGDCDSVQSQWVESSDYLDFLDCYEDEIKVIAKAKGEAK